MQRFDLNNITRLPVQVAVKEMEASEAEIRAAIQFAVAAAKRQEVAAIEPIGPNGQPRMLQLSAWIAFADEVNDNGCAFVKDDMEEAVANGMFAAPYFGMIDFNHDFNLYGVWHSAKFAFDTASGKFGIYAEGSMFAWRFTELADAMLAQQARQGHIDVSMACLFKYYEPGVAPDGSAYRIGRKPTFFTTSLLDIDPAFKNARAAGSEDPANTPMQREEQLRTSGVTASNEEATMSKKNTPAPAAAEVATVVEQVEEVIAETVEQVETVVEAVVEQVEEVVAEVVAEVEGEEVVPVETPEAAPVEGEEVAPVEAPEAVEPVDVPPAAAPAAVEPTETVEAPAVAPEPAPAPAEAETAALLRSRVVVLEAEVSTQAEQLASLTTELASLREFKAARDAEQAAARRAARLAQIPAAVQTAMATEENADLLESWMTMEEAMWDKTRKLFSTASVTGRPSKADLSATEGVLSGTSDREEGEYAISRWTASVRRQKAAR